MAKTYRVCCDPKTGAYGRGRIWVRESMFSTSSSARPHKRFTDLAAAWEDADARTVASERAYGTGKGYEHYVVDGRGNRVERPNFEEQYALNGQLWDYLEELSSMKSIKATPELIAKLGEAVKVARKLTR